MQKDRFFTFLTFIWAAYKTAAKLEIISGARGMLPKPDCLVGSESLACRALVGKAMPAL